MKKTGFQLFVREKPTLALIHSNDFFDKGEKYINKISREINCTYSHALKIIEEFQVLGLVKLEKKGRIKLIKLTEKGKELSKHLKAVKDSF